MSDDPPLDWGIPEDPYHGDPMVPCYRDVPRLANSYIGQTLFNQLSDMTATSLAGQVNKVVKLEHILKFFDGYNGISPAAADIAPRHHEAWKQIADGLHGAEEQLHGAINLAKTSLSGDTVSAILQKATDSIHYLQSLANSAARMDPLVDTFSRDIKETKDWFETMNTKLEKDIWNLIGQNHLGEGYKPNQAKLDELMALYDHQARAMIQEYYNPPIEWISHRHPDTSGAGAPGSPGAPGGPSSPGMGGGPPSGLKSGGVGMPQMPTFPTNAPNDPSVGQPSSPSDALKGLGDAAKGAGDAANTAAQKAQDAAAQAGNAANQALGQLGKGGQNGSAGLPEGVLGLGPNGLKGAVKPAGSAGGRGSGGAGAHTQSLSNPSAQLAGTSKAVTAAQTSRASVGSGGGAAGGGGAPVAGHRGAGADKAHKASKALRLTKHGQEVIGEADAVVPVVGDQPKESAPAKPS